MPEAHCVDTVIGNDNRVLVSNTEIAPFSAIAYIEVSYPVGGPPSHGTAVLISPNVALTAAHCLYDSEKGGWPTEIEFYPAMTNTTGQLEAPFGYALAREVVMSLPYFENGSNPQWDWGLIRLDSNIGYVSGFLGFQYLNITAQDLPIMISGYPADLNNTLPFINQYYDAGHIYYDETSRTVISNFEVYKTRYFVYAIDTYSGQSGSPILYYTEGAYRIIGIHTNGFSSSNSGFGITDEVFRFLSTYKNYYS